MMGFPKNQVILQRFVNANAVHFIGGTNAGMSTVGEQAMVEIMDFKGRVKGCIKQSESVTKEVQGVEGQAEPRLKETGNRIQGKALVECLRRLLSPFELPSAF